MSKRPRRFKATFENRGFWEYYKDLERQFENFLEYLPYLDINERVCSFRLVNLLLSIGGHVDSAFKEMAFFKEFSRNEKCMEIRKKVKETRRRIKIGQSPLLVKISECLDAFEPIYGLSNKNVILKRLPEREIVTPFTPYNRRTNAPKWWDIYNGLKHDFSSNFERANLEVTRNALAGAFLLNVIHKPAILHLNDFGILKWPPQQLESKDAEPEEHSLVIVPRFVLKDMLERNQSLWCFVETPLFIYDFNPKEENSDE